MAKHLTQPLNFKITYKNQKLGSSQDNKIFKEHINQFPVKKPLLEIQDVNEIIDKQRSADKCFTEASPKILVDVEKQNHSRGCQDKNKNAQLKGYYIYPICSKINSSEEKIEKIPENPLMSRVQSDLDSPYAKIRMKADRALKSPPKDAHKQLNVHQTEQSNSIEDGKSLISETRLIQDLMCNVVVYVEVRTGEDNRSSGVKKVISALGARVNDKLLRDTTHVVFKDGLLSTYKKAKNWNIPIVSILWIEACKEERKICNPEEYPISNVERYEYPELYEKMKRHKSMQPDSECNKRLRQNVCTPKACKANECSTPVSAANVTPIMAAKEIKQTIISKFFGKQTVGTEFPKKSLERITSVNITKNCSDQLSSPSDLLREINDSNKIVNSSSEIEKTTLPSNPSVQLEEKAEKDANEEKLKDCDINMKPFSKENVMNVAKSDEVLNKRTRKRKSCISSNQNMEIKYSPRTTRRRSFIQIKENKTVTTTPMGTNTKGGERLLEFSSIENKTVTSFEDGKKLEKNPNNQLARRKTTYFNNTLESSNFEENTPKANLINRRRTLYTPQKMEETLVFTSLKNNEVDIGGKHEVKGMLLNQEITPQSSNTIQNNEKFSNVYEVDQTKGKEDNKITNIKCLNTNNSAETTDLLIKNGKSKQEGTVKIPNIKNILIENQSTPLSFSSSRKPGLRRTMFEDSMDIITLRLQKINKTSRTSLINQSIEDMEEREKTILNRSITTPNLPSQLLRHETQTNTVTTTSSIANFANKVSSGSASIPGTRKRRTLFKPEDTQVQITPTSTKPKKNVLFGPNSKRRRTVNFFEPEKELRVLSPQTLSPKTQMRQSRSTIINHEQKNKIESLSTAMENKSTEDSIINPSTSSTFYLNLTERSQPLPSIVYTNMHKEQIKIIHEAVKKLGGFNLENAVSDATTHVLSLEARRTLNLLRALARGLWILEYNWIVESLAAGKWLREEPYEIKDFSRAIVICRSERQAFGVTYRCELFTHLGPFYISSRCGPISSENLKELIYLCGGKISDTRKNAKYVLGDCNKSMDDKIYVTPFWILDSITQMQLLKINKYYIPVDSSKQTAKSTQ